MKRILKAAVPAFAAALMLAGPAMAAKSHQAFCQKVQAELASGKTRAQVAKDLKTSKSAIDRCNAKVASAKKHGSKSGSTSTSQPAKAN